MLNVLAGTIKPVAWNPWFLSQQIFSYFCDWPYTPLMWVLTVTGRLGLLVWLQTCLVTTDFSGNLDSRLKPDPVPGPALLTLLRRYVAVLVRPVPCLLCCAQLPAHLSSQSSSLLLSVQWAVCLWQRHLDPPTLIALTAVTWQRQTGWGL